MVGFHCAELLTMHAEKKKMVIGNDALALHCLEKEAIVPR